MKPLEAKLRDLEWASLLGCEGNDVKRSREDGLAMSQVGWVAGKALVGRISDAALG
jgi:hypothetical protein